VGEHRQAALKGHGLQLSKKFGSADALKGTSLQAAEKVRVAVELAFRPASKPFVFFIPSGL
jgi:hypothetical protein